MINNYLNKMINEYTGRVNRLKYLTKKRKNGEYVKDLIAIEKSLIESSEVKLSALFGESILKDLRLLVQLNQSRE